MNSDYIPRSWQKSAFDKIDNILSNDRHELMPINATVGSGKTDLACYSFGKFIIDNKDKKTISVFVSPRIKLCSQQENSLAKFIDLNFDLIHKTDYYVNTINCENNNFNRKSGELTSDHAVFMFCAESLWGIEDNADDKELRWHRWKKYFKNWNENGYDLGVIFYDESHNYDRQYDKMMELSQLFKLNMFASGTPSYYQKEMSKNNKKNVCSCTPYEAMSQKMICIPSLNVIKGNADIDFPSAICAVLKREMKICENEVFIPHILVNCSGIDQIAKILEHKWFKGKIGKDFHVITVHSEKEYKDENIKKRLYSRIDNDCEKSSQEAYEIIEKLDEQYFNDSLPVVVFQVGMIGEGINVKCFNSTIITTHSDKTAMQQIGRAIRNYEKDGKNKIDDGHANIYAFVENLTELKQLILNLQNYDLTDDCYSWGKIIDVSTSSGMLHNPEFDELSELNDFAWADITDIDILPILDAAESKCMKRIRNEYMEYLFDTDPSLVDEFMTALAKSDYQKEFGNLKGISKYSSAKFWDELKSKKADMKEKLKNSSTDKSKADDKDKECSTELSKDMIFSFFIKLINYINNGHKEIFETLFFSEHKVKFLEKIFGSRIIAEFFAMSLKDDIMNKIFKRA